MRLIKTAKDRIQFMLDFASMDLADTQTFTDADLAVLREEFCRYLGYFRGQDGKFVQGDSEVTIEEYGGFQPLVVRKPLPQHFERADFLSLQEKISNLLHGRFLIIDALDQSSKANKTRSFHPQLDDKGRKGIDLGIEIYAGWMVGGTAVDVALFIFLILTYRLWDTILRCPNWNSRVCSKKFFIKEGKSIYCSLRCGNAFRVRKSLGLKKKSMKKKRR